MNSKKLQVLFFVGRSGEFVLPQSSLLVEEKNLKMLLKTDLDEGEYEGACNVCGGSHCYCVNCGVSYCIICEANGCEA
jgi:hypothetical protein